MKNIKFLRLRFIIFSQFLFLNIQIHADENEYRLINHLLNNYNIYARPSFDHRDATNITFGLSLSQLIDVDEKNQIITTNCWITMFWLDNKLSWNISEYGGLTEIRLPHERIWKPDIILYNNADALASLSQIQTQMIITSNGNVTWLSTNIYKSSCSINVQNYPFDLQNCSLAFASWTYDGTQINLLKNSDTGDTSNYIENGEWFLENLLVERNVKIYSCCPQPYPNVTFYVVIRRRPLFYVFNMIMPSLLITLVGFLIFLIPPDSGEKVGMGVTTLLSMTVFLMVVAEKMPPNSDSVPLIAIYYFSSMLMISLATVAAVFTAKVCKKGDQEIPVPEWLKIIFFDVIAKILFIKIKANRDLNKSVKEIFSDKTNNNYNEKFTNTTLYSYKMNLKNKNRESFIYNLDDYLEKIKKNKQYLEIWQINHESIAKRLSAQPSPIIYNRNNTINNEMRSAPFSQNRNKNGVKYKTTPKNNNIETTISINSTFFNNNAKVDGRIGKGIEINSGNNVNKNELNLDYDYANIANNKRLLKLLKILNQHMEQSDLKEIKNDYKSDLKSQWKQLAEIFDIILGYFFLFSTIGLLIYLYKSIN